jgi:exopolysaccharide production protein ExoQ
MIGKDPGMNGRTAIWSSLMSAVLKHPLVGYGYRAFWRGLSGESANTILRVGWTGMGYAENGVLELWLELGAVGVLLYALVFISAAKDAVYCLRRNPPPSTMWYASILFYLVISNIWDGNLLLPSFLQCILPFVAYAGLRRDVGRLRELGS